MTSSSHQRVCLDCGASLPEDSPASTCARCLLEVCFEDESVYGAPEAAVGIGSELAEPGEVFGDYELLEEIARGGMGVIFKARQRSLDRVVALKMMLPGRLGSQETVRRFRIEAEAASRLRHPGIVAIHEVGQCEGQHFYSMDYVDGCDLARRVAHAPVAPQMAAAWVRAIAEAIHHAHQHGILHRDLKPGNVLIDSQEQAHVTDFGLAKLLEEGRNLTATGHVLGTPSFMPPEQADPNRGLVSVASDVYGLGAILYFLLTGNGPFDGNSVEHTIKMVLTEEPIAPSRNRSGIPRDLETICLKCLSKEPQHRYASAAELAEDLGAWSRREPIRARPVSPLERCWFWARRNPGLAVVSASLVITILIGAALQERALTETRRAQAVAEGLNQFLLKDLTDQLRPIGRLRLLDNVNRAVEGYYQGKPMNNSSDPRTGKIQFYQNDAAVQREMGRLEQAEQSARSAITLLEPLLAAEPNKPEWATSLADAHAEMRNILVSVDAAAALQHARETVRYCSHAQELNPTNFQALLKLANARLELASVLQKQRATRQAAEEVHLATELLARLPATGSEALSAREQVALSFYYKGLVQFDQGDKDQARLSFKEYLDRTTQLANDPAHRGDARLLLNLAIAHGHLGRALQDDNAAALEHFQEYRKLAEQLKNLDPGNVNYQREYGLSLGWEATALMQSADPAQVSETTKLLVSSHDCFRKLADDFPQGDLWQEHAARTANQLADWQIKHGHPDEARTLLANEVGRRWSLLLQLSTRRANHRRFHEALRWSEDAGGPPAAVASTRSERLREWLAKINLESNRPGASPEWLWNLATLHQEIAVPLAKQMDLKGARSELELALACWQQLASQRPNDEEAAAGIAHAFWGVNLAILRSRSDMQQPLTLRPFVDWLRSRRPNSPGGPQVLENAQSLLQDLQRTNSRLAPDEEASVRDLSDALRKFEPK